MKEFLTDVNTRRVVVDIREQSSGGVLYNLEDSITEIASQSTRYSIFFAPTLQKHIRHQPDSFDGIKRLGSNRVLKL